MKTNAIKFIIVVLMGFTYQISEGQQLAAKHRFDVYGFIVYGGYVDNGNEVNSSYKGLQQYLSYLGILKYNLIYESRILNYASDDKAKVNGELNLQKIKAFADEALQEPNVPVSLDLEGWKRFDTIKTPARMIAAIRAFRNSNKVSKVGLYATVPQNTYGYPANINIYDKLNKAYAGVAAEVDYFSPSLYNYKNTNNNQWKKAASYSIAECRKYGYPAKKILPYVTPEVTTNKITTLLTYDEMMFRLQTLYDLGADGCLIWTSSSTRDANGKKVYVDANAGWLKAVKDFIASHR